MATTTPRRMIQPNLLARKEGQRIAVPEGGELVCYRTDDGLTLKVEYSREMMVKLSASIFCHLRPPGFAQIARETPELIGLPSPIPLTSGLPTDSTPQLPNFSPSRLHLFSPLRGPVTPATESMRLLSIQREYNKRMLELDTTGASDHNSTNTDI